MTFDDLFPNLAAWVDMGNEIQIGNSDAGTLIACIDDGGVVYETPTDITDFQKALELAEAAIGEWLDENEDD